MKRRSLLAATVAIAGSMMFGGGSAFAESKEFVYITPDAGASFWRYVGTGAAAAAKEAGYKIETLSSNQDAQTQLKNVQDAITKGVAGIVISPTDSSTAPSALKLAQDAGIPVAIADIGTNSGEYVTLIGSDNYGGAKGIGEATAAKLIEKGWTDGSYGIIGIPQTRINGQARTKGFRDAMNAGGITKEVSMFEMKAFTAEESFKFAQDMMTASPDLRAIFVQTDGAAVGAARAVKAARKSNDIIVAAFDGTPELVDLIKKGEVLGSGMQQPYLMGFSAAELLAKHIAGETVEKEVALPILVGTTDNIAGMLEEVNLNVFAVFIVVNNEELLLSAQNVTKKFGAFSALKGVSFNLKAGEIHALFGANGAGKSTLAKVICGHHPATDGELKLKGNLVRFQRPRDAMEAGVGIVTQETSLANDLAVWENIVLPMYGTKNKSSRSELRDIANAALDKLGFLGEISIDKICGELSSAHRQLVEIARTVALDSDVIIFDEPTAALSPSESTRLFKVMDGLRDAGHGLIFVSHRLEEIFSMTDRITVLRDGHSIQSDLITSELTQAELIRHMVGKEVESLQAEDIPDTSKNDVLLKLDHVKAEPFVKDVSLQIHAGEIVGLGGLVGAGRSEVAEMLMGFASKSGGAIELLGQPYEPVSPKEALASGLGFLPEDRRRQSIIPDFSVRENILLSHLSQLSGSALKYETRSDRINELADLIELARDRLDDTSLLNFSGGMQQKALIIRALMLKPKVLILDEPTKGVDIGSRSTIYALLRRLASEGMAILLISSDFEELLALSHRVVPNQRWANNRQRYCA
ncbi:Ribose import ATP-binding protein RbsA [Nymphon striatum]|nr:Ribose import ATP-binding protein RbsA [Nymphon striatum]